MNDIPEKACRFHQYAIAIRRKVLYRNKKLILIAN